MKTALQLQQRLVAFIGGARDDFDALALEVFAFQFERNAVYRAFCEQKKCTPNHITHWSEIPAVPSSVFKHLSLTCFPPDEAVAEFHTSGTTRTQSGKHFFKTLALYAIMITGSVWEKVVFGRYLFAPAFYWEDVFSMLVLALHTAYLVALATGALGRQELLILALAAYATYVINATQFLLKLRAARLDQRNDADDTTSEMVGAVP